MISSKNIVGIIFAILCVSLFACGFIVYAANTFETKKIPEYERKMFGEDVAVIDIEVDSDEWESMMDNAQSKEWISGDVIVNGNRFGTVGIRTKGNSSLTMGNRSGTSGDSNYNYSLNFKANKYVKGQTFFGLDTFCVNNMVGDATYMKDYMAYDIMEYIGVDTPLTNYAKITVNGEDYGFGIMLERYDESFLERVYSTSAGELYSVKVGMGQRGDFEDMWQDVENGSIGGFAQGNFAGRINGGGNSTELPQGDFAGRTNGDGNSTELPQGDFAGRTNGDDNSITELPQGDFAGNDRRSQGGFGGDGGFMGGRGSMGGGSLVYTDDNPGSYSSIFSNSVKNPDKISDKDKKKVVTAIKNLNSGTDLEEYIDVDATLRYFAAHTVMVNNDSYTSNMAQNYYLYERGGILTILPWDYNLSFGGMGGMGGSSGSSGASGVVNFPIDTPVSGVSMEDRPLLNKLLEVPEYKERYHEYLEDIVDGYFASGLFEDSINETNKKIDNYVKNDVSANFTYEQYVDSLPMFIELLRLRSESIRGQLNGTIPATSSGQSADNSGLIDASGINLNALGSMGGNIGGNIGNNMGGDRMPNGNMGNIGEIDMQLMQQAMQILTESGGELTAEVKSALSELGLTDDQMSMFANIPNGFGGAVGQRGGRTNLNPNASANSNTNMNPNANANPNASMNPQSNLTAVGSRTDSAAAIVVLTILLIGSAVFIAKPRKDSI